MEKTIIKIKFAAAFFIFILSACYCFCACQDYTIDGLANCCDPETNAQEVLKAFKINITPGHIYTISYVSGCVWYGNPLWGTRLRIRQADDLAGTNVSAGYQTVGDGSWVEYGVDTYHTSAEAVAASMLPQYNSVTITASQNYFYIAIDDDLTHLYCGDNKFSEVINVCDGLWTPTPSPTITQTGTCTFTATPSLPTTLTKPGTPTVTATFTSTDTLTCTVTPTLTITPTITPTTPPFCLSLLGSFPNPATQELNIVYDLCRDSDITVKIYTVSGEMVRKLTQQGRRGKNAIYWDCRNGRNKNAASGVFIYSLEAVSENDKGKKWGKLAVNK